MNKRGYYFTLDAMIAVILIFGILLTVNTIQQEETSSSHIQRDLIETLSSLKMSEVDNSYAEELRQENKTSGNITVLEQIAEFYAKDMSEGKKLAESIVENLSTGKNFGIWVDGELIASSNSTSINESESVWSSKQMIRGIEKSEEGDGDIRGYSAKAYLAQSKNQKYNYFGGYVGEGNVSLRVDCKGGVEDARLEIATNKDFDVYINGNFSGHYENSSSERNPSEYDLSSYSERFREGENIVKLVGEGLYVAGGFMKIEYNESQTFNQSQRYYFPGIEGLMNLYDGFYVPENLTSMKISLHMNNNYSSFMKIGNVSVFNGTTSGEETITINNTELSSKLDYEKMEEKTVPLRLGIENMSYEKKKKFRIFSVAPLPSSFSSVKDNEGNQKEDVIINANQEFAKKILETNSSEIGLVGIYGNTIPESFSHDLSTNYTSLNNTMNNWDLKSGVCLCCGINESINRMLQQSDSRDIRHILLMADNEPTDDCGSGDPVADSINMACNASEDHDIVFDTVALGDNDKGQAMLQEISNCSNGSYFEGAYENTSDVYLEAAKNITDLIYSKQTITSEDDIWTKLYPDSYIDFEYEKKDLPYGLFITSESDNFNSSSMTSFYVPENSTVVNARAISYSGPKWTKTLEIENETWDTIYNISKYNQDYVNLGDPYTVNIPSEEIKEGNNKVRLKTGLSPSNSSSSSLSDKVIYTIIKRALGYSSISSTSQGCDWTIEFYDSTNMTVSIPEGNNNTQECYYTSEKISYDENDAIAKATYDLLRNLDFDSDNRVDSKFSENNLDIQTSGITGIPYTYGTEVEIRAWR